MMELLAPAGDLAALEAAVKGGADAVYLGLTTLNARRGAGNFDAPGLADACRYCHERGVKVYVTVNTLVKDGELGELEGVAQALYRADADGAIVQDLGAAAALRQMLPGLALHASTQMAIHNRQGVRYLKNQGFARAVLARELRYHEIAQCAGEGVEIEVFGHGALCVACSGQCLFSSLVGGRSGNRGLCAQPCRLPYRMDGPLCRGAGDLLSPKDLCAIENLDRLQQAGVASLKLEGRLKGPDYVYKVTSLYRLALDGQAVDPHLLRQVFNRGYTQGYLPGVDDGELMSVPDEKHVLPDAGHWPQPPERAVPLTGALRVRVGQPMALTLTDGQVTCRAEGPIVQVAHKAADPRRMGEQIGKMGGTPYALGDLQLAVDEDAFAPLSALNLLRRQALARLGDLRCPQRLDPPRPLKMPAMPSPPPGKPLLLVESSDGDMLRSALTWGADECVWAPADVTQAGLSRAPQFPFALALPPTLTGDCLDAVNRWALDRAGDIRATYLSNPAHLALHWPGQLRVDGPMNVANALTASLLGMPYMPSPELTCHEIRALPGDKELLVYGRMTLMLLRHCPMNHLMGGGAHLNCHRCDGCQFTVDDHVLVDRMGARFPLSRLNTGEGCLVQVLNSVPLMALKKLAQLPPSGRWRVRLTDEDQALAQMVVTCHRRALDGAPDGPQWATLSKLPATTGHYFRGVE